MATITTLVAEGHLIAIDPELESWQRPVRRLLALPRAAKWIAEELPSAGSTWNIEVTPLEQADALFADFCAGEEMVFEHQYKCLKPHNNGVWELKTPDLRFFGWFAHKDSFIVSAANTAQFIKENDLYRGYRNQSVVDRDALSLTPPKFVPGDQPHEVITNWTFPDSQGR